MLTFLCFIFYFTLAVASIKIKLADYFERAGEHSKDVNFFNPRSIQKNWFPLGSVVSKDEFASNLEVYLVKFDDNLMAHPLSYELIYRKGKRYVYRPKAPSGFKCIADVAVYDAPPPSVENVVCILQSALTTLTVDSFGLAKYSKKSKLGPYMYYSNSLFTLYGIREEILTIFVPKPPSIITDRPLRVLSLDGGGVRGTSVATILEYLENQTKKPIHELFDVIVGTSTGGIIALALSVPNTEGKIFSATEILNVYKTKASTIFDPNQKELINLLQASYANSGMIQVLREMYPCFAFLREAVVPVGVVTHDKKNLNAILINSEEAKMYPWSRSDVEILHAGLATSAAPTFLPGRIILQRSEYFHPTKTNQSMPFHLEKNAPRYFQSFVDVEDGGIAANNPIQYALSYAQAIYGKDYEYEIFSIGTGEVSNFSNEEYCTLSHESVNNLMDGASVGLLNVAVRLVKEIASDPFYMKRSSQHAINTITNHTVYRIQYEISEYQAKHMDDSSPNNIESLVQIGKEAIQSSSFNNFMKALMRHGDSPKPLSKLKFPEIDSRAHRNELIDAEYISHGLYKRLSRCSVMSERKPIDPFVQSMQSKISFMNMPRGKKLEFLQNLLVYFGETSIKLPHHKIVSHLNYLNVASTDIIETIRSIVIKHKKVFCPFIIKGFHMMGKVNQIQLFDLFYRIGFATNFKLQHKIYILFSELQLVPEFILYGLFNQVIDVDQRFTQVQAFASIKGVPKLFKLKCLELLNNEPGTYKDYRTLFNDLKKSKFYGIHRLLIDEDVSHIEKRKPEDVIEV